MFFVKLLRFSRGYVKFAATGIFLERFLNMSVRHGINIWNIERSEESVSACTEIGSYKKLRPFAKKAGVRLRVCERCGVPFKAYRYRKRSGLLVGVLLFVIFLCAMGQFVWHIEVQGNEALPQAEVLATMEELGLRCGVRRGALNVRELEREALLRLQQLSWVAININGSTVIVDVRERIMPPQMFPDDDKLCNIVAARDGLIVYMEVYEGQSVLKVGDTVQAGDIIVSGIIEDKKGQDTVKHARAKVIAQSEYELVVEVPYTEVVRHHTDEQKRRRYLRVFGTDMPLFIYRPFTMAYDLQRTIMPISLLGMPLPLAYIDETYHFYIEQQQKISQSERKQRALAELEKLEQIELVGAKIIVKQVEFKNIGNMHTLEAKYLCNIDIAKEQEFLINE